MEYTVFGDRADGTYDGIDPTHAHLNPPATLMWAHGFEKSPVVLQFDIPAGSGWKIATQLAPQDDGTWTAPGMDRMMESPGGGVGGPGPGGGGGGWGVRPFT